MTGLEAFLSVVLMIFIFGIFVSFVVLMGMFRAQEYAERRKAERAAHRGGLGESAEEFLD